MTNSNLILSGQVERVNQNGVKHISYPNKMQRVVYPDGSEEVDMNDGTTVRINVDGTEVVELPNGERETRSKQYHVSEVDFQCKIFFEQCSASKPV